MEKEMLEIHYHPVKKEVKFKRLQHGVEIPISKDSKLMPYMNKKGDFLLQNYGNKFATDIAAVFDGEKEIALKALTTKEDFEDLTQMIEYFNKTSNCKINLTMLDELEDMGSMYSRVEDYGRKAVEVLQKHQSSIANINTNNDNAKKVASRFCEETKMEIDNILGKITSLAENTISLCFTGVYSSGKSALINAILGYAILPENIKSETSKLFKIQSPKYNETVSIEFQIDGHETKILWNECLQHFEFDSGPADSESRKKIQSSILEFNKSPQYIQLCEILKLLNSDSIIGADINIHFPIPLDSKQVQFTIYDTPGTDSNFVEHQTILKKSLSKQTNSILIFVATPDKLEGEGNNALLEYLKETNQKSDRTCIDIARSLFVINKTDTTNHKSIEELKTGKIQYNKDEKLSINLADQKLFFTSAKIAYSAKAQARGIGTDEEKSDVEEYINKTKKFPYTCYFRHNHCATSEYTTKKMIESCEDYLTHCQDKNDHANIVHISSGLYALEKEIQVYGQKYAIAVRAYAIIESVNKPLSRLRNNVKLLKEESKKGIGEIDDAITVMKNTIKEFINQSYKKHCIPESEPIPDNILRFIGLDSNHLKTHFVDKVQACVEEELKSFSEWNISFSDKQNKNAEKREHEKAQIDKIIDEAVRTFTENFLKQQQICIEQSRDNFTTYIGNKIGSNSELSDAAKKFIIQIRKPYVEKLSIEAVYNNNTWDKTALFSLVEIHHFDKKNFQKNLEGELLSLVTNIADKFKKDTYKNHEAMLKKLKTEFIENADQYALLLKAQYEDKEIMTSIYEKISSADSDLSKSQAEFDAVVWRAKNNESTIYNK